MLIDTTAVSKWYVIHHGFKVYEHCPRCQGQAISYHKARRPGMRGIAPQCHHCRKLLPVRFKLSRPMKQFARLGP